MSARWLSRSTRAPAGRRSTNAVPASTEPTRPARAAEPVSSSTTSGYANDEMLIPRFETAWPTQSAVKSRLRRSDEMPDRRDRDRTARLDGAVEVPVLPRRRPLEILLGELRREPRDGQRREVERRRTVDDPGRNRVAHRR